MRLVVLCALSSTACQAVFPRDADPGDADVTPAPARRSPFTAQVIAGTALQLELPATVEAGDFIVGTIQADRFTNHLNVIPFGWQVFDDFPDGQCDNNAQWHAWIVAARVDPAMELTFGFQISDDTVSGLFVPYANASAVSYLRKATPMNMSNDNEVRFPASDTAPGSIVHVGEMGDVQAADDAEGMTRIGAFDKIVAFDLAISGDQIPEIKIPIPANTCLGAAQLKVEP